MKTLNIVFIRSPQPMLVGGESGGLYSPNRTLTPEPTLPQLEGILREFSEKSNVPIEVVQLDLRDPRNGTVNKLVYGTLQLPYINEPIQKVIDGVNIEDVTDILERADFIGFTNNFAMARRVIANNIRAVRNQFPSKEIWIGGRDVFTDRVTRVYTDAADNQNTVVFSGHVHDSLPAYLNWKLRGVGEPYGITVFDSEGRRTSMKERSLIENAVNNVRSFALPVYSKPESLDYFRGSGEGQPSSPFGRFVHMSVSIGCPQNCGYCTTGCREPFLIWKDTQTLQAELDLYKRMGVETVAIMDDNILHIIESRGISEFIGIMDLINSYGFNIEYGNGLQLSLLSKHWDAVSEVVFKNCVSLYAPVEDLTKNRLYDKLESKNSQMRLMQKLTREVPESLKYVTMGVIVGVPVHTMQSLQRTFLRNVELFLNIFKNSKLEVGMTVFNFMPLPGTKFGERALDSGRMVVDDPFSADPEVCSFGTPSYSPPGMTHGDVFKIYEQALNMNPAGKKLGVTYVDLQRMGEGVLPENKRHKIPAHWRVPGYHLRARVT